MGVKTKDYKYKVIKEDKKDKLKSTIEKTGVSVEFNLREVLDHKFDMEKQLFEAEAQIELFKKQMEAATKRTPFLKKISEMEDIDQKMIATYFQKKQEREQFEIREKLLKDTIKEYKKELKMISEQIGIELPKNNFFVKTKKSPKELFNAPKQGKKDGK